jgi:hypothetical protein
MVSIPRIFWSCCEDAGQRYSGKTTVDTQEEGITLLTSKNLVLDCALTAAGQKTLQRRQKCRSSTNPNWFNC